MKIYFQYDPDNKTGKGKFLNRLKPELEKLGCKIQYDLNGADITLGVTRWRGDTTKKRVLRIDGIHLLNDKHHVWNNQRIKKAIRKSDAVIYQSKWAKYMINNIFKIDPVCYTIYNGADPEDYKETIKSPYPKNVVLSSKWKAGDDRRMKRLREMYEIAKICVEKRSDVCFWIAGFTDMKDEKIERIKWLGLLEDSDLRKYLSMGDVYLHLTWWSWCDNSLVEAICAGCVPIGNDICGNYEMIKEAGGIGVAIDKPLKPRADYSSNKPPKFDHAPVLTALDDALDNKRIVNCEHVHIKNIAKQYYEVFKSVLN